MPTQTAQLPVGSAAPWRALIARFSPDAASITPLVVLLLLGHLLLWTTLAAISHSAPDVDNMEELVWGNVFQLGYYKHPPFPSWVLFALASVFGRPVWLTFLAGQLSVVVALWCVWRLGCEMTSQKNALVAVLVVTLITYFNIHGIVFNHNTMQLCSIAACHWMFYRSWRDGRWRDWWLFGFCCGLAMLTKYSALIQFATYFLFLLITGSLKRAAVWRGIALATATFALVFAPHAWWLSQQTLGPLHYANGSLCKTMTRPEQLHMFGELFATTLARLAPMGIGLMLIAVLMKYAGARTGAPAAGKLIDSLRPADRRFLVVVGLGPFVLTLLVAMVMNTRIVAPWTTTFYLLFGFITLWIFQNDAGSRLLRTCIKVVILLQVVFALGYAAGRGPLSNMAGRPTRATFPGHAVSMALQTQWDQHSRTPLGLVAADTWLGGNIAIYGGRRVDVLIDGDFGHAPWVTRERALDCGMLVALNRSPKSTDGVPSATLLALMATATVKGVLQIPWTSKTDGPQVVVEWGIVPALPSCGQPH